MYVEGFNERIREARKKANYTQEEVSEITKIARSTIANYETGRNQPDIETLGILIDLYKTNARQIIGTEN